jgi:hypothetical protein
MPTFISKGGEWYPAKEHAVLPHLSGTDREIYDGPDRAALLMLWQESGKPEDALKCMTFLGSNFKSDPDFINRVRQLGFDNVDKYLAFIGYDEKKANAQAEKNMVTVTSHQVLKRAKAIENDGGGVEFGTGEVLAKGAIGDVSFPV